jgi:hypothetical protein
VLSNERLAEKPPALDLDIGTKDNPKPDRDRKGVRLASAVAFSLSKFKGVKEDPAHGKYTGPSYFPRRASPTPVDARRGV